MTVSRASLPLTAAFSPSPPTGNCHLEMSSFADAKVCLVSAERYSGTWRYLRIGSSYLGPTSDPSGPALSGAGGRCLEGLETSRLDPCMRAEPVDAYLGRLPNIDRRHQLAGLDDGHRGLTSPARPRSDYLRPRAATGSHRPRERITKKLSFCSGDSSVADAKACLVSAERYSGTPEPNSRF
jgi:hypothetical protein